MNRGAVVAYSPEEGFNPRSHESVTRTRLAEKLAKLKGYAFAGEYRDGKRYPGALYFVPGRTLAGCDAARLGIGCEDDLFGGVVPHPFVGTKTITHPLARAQARAPAGWSAHFPEAVKDAVLTGYAAFAPEDAACAGERLLAHGEVRVKPALALGGRGQSVVADLQQLTSAIQEIDATELASCGIVLEQNLAEVTTYSVGQVRVGKLVATYFGTQNLARDNRGAEVYGGSDLIVARGDFDALLELDLGADAQRAVMQARTYDRAAREHYPGLFASRRNYDIAKGLDRAGASCCGVLEQSWRIGGASGAEVAALEVFDGDPEARAVRARSVEVYGENAALPAADATVYFRGIDEKVGFITKYVTVEPYDDAR